MRDGHASDRSFEGRSQRAFGAALGPDDDIPPGTVVLLASVASHLDLDLGWAFRDIGWELLVWGKDEERQFNAALRDIRPPGLVVYADAGGPVFPSLLRCHLPTVVLHRDSYSYLAARVRRSQLFDVVCSYHPGLPLEVLRRTHPKVLLFPHVVAPEAYQDPGRERDLEVGWVGTARASIYARRRELLPKLSRAFVMNDWERRYPPVLIPGIYGRSKIVVNISRDDWPSDANTRVFEAMAAGALLVTSLPSELTELGFVEGRHFVGYREDPEVIDVVRHWLRDDAGRAAIAEAGRTKILSEFTYGHRVRTLARIAIDEGAQLVAGRRLSESAAASLILEQYLQERRWSSLGGRLLPLVSAARLGVVPVVRRGLASIVRSWGRGSSRAS